jgi:hypothetical protein
LQRKLRCRAVAPCRPRQPPDHGYDASLQKHYGFDFTALEQQWREYVAAAGALAAR